jgi:hypothetical protein
MIVVWSMVAASAVSWVAAAAIAGHTADLFWGMAGPLVAACASWLVAAATFRRSPTRLTSVMAAVFACKLVLFGLYVAAAIRLLGVRPVPFVVSFTGYFIALHAAEAFSLHRLFTGRMHAAR